MPTLLTDRAGGVSSGPYGSFNLGDHVGDDAAAVGENRRLAAARVAGRPDGERVWAVRYMRQVHGDRVALVRGDGPPPEADALVTDEPGLALAVLVADCVPVLLEAPGLVAVAHAGRRGTETGVVGHAVTAMRRLGDPMAEVIATIGPSICGKCYEVPAAMRDEVAAVVPEATSTTRAGTPALDLRAGLVAQLRAAGVERISVDERCTAEDPSLFSYRRDGVTGRFAGLAWLA